MDYKRDLTRNSDKLTHCSHCQRAISRRTEVCPCCGVITYYGRLMENQRKLDPKWQEEVRKRQRVGWMVAIIILCFIILATIGDSKDIAEILVKMTLYTVAYAIYYLIKKTMSKK